MHGAALREPAGRPTGLRTGLRCPASSGASRPAHLAHAPLPTRRARACDTPCTPQEKREQKKEAKRKARAGSDEEDAAGEEAGGGFEVNLSDPRFSDMFRSAEFALDPTDPRFKKMQVRVYVEVISCVGMWVWDFAGLEGVNQRDVRAGRTKLNSRLHS